MAVLILILLISLGACLAGVTDYSAILGSELQSFCQTLLPDSQFQFAYGSMVCGVNLPPGILRADLQRTGLLHLFVVSGSHLIFFCTLLETLCRQSPRARTIIPFILVTYTFLAGLNPPVVRSLVAMGVSVLNIRYKLFWRRFDETLYSGAFCLLICPAWWKSLSFHLSWTASLGLTFKGGPLRKAGYIYLLLLLPLAGLGISDPFTILLNWLLAPVLGLILFPLSLLATIFHPAGFLVDWLWQEFFLLLPFLARWLGPTVSSRPTPLYACWLALLILHFVLTLGHAFRVRKTLQL